MSGLPILYSFRRCPYAIRARLALQASETCCAIREVKLSAKPAELIAASPKATVPVLVLPDGRVIDESLDIMRWALVRRDPTGWLNRIDVALIETNDGPFKHHLDRAKYPDRYGEDAALHYDACVDLLGSIEDRLTGSQYLCDNEPGMTDAAVSALHCGDQCRHAEEGDGALDVVGEDVEAGFGGHVLQPSRLEVASAHPVLQRAEDVLDRSPADAHGTRPAIEAGLAPWGYGFRTIARPLLWY